MVYLYEGFLDHSWVFTIGASLGALALHDSGHAWLSGIRCSPQKEPPQ